MQKDKKYYDDFYTKHHVDVHDYPARFKAVSELLDGWVLDVACGTGTLADYFTGDYIGCDISSSAIAAAKQARRSNASFNVCDFTEHVNLPDDLFDRAYLGEFLEHIEDDTIVFQNLLRVLDSNGRIVVTVPNGDRVPDESHCRIFTVPQIRRDYSKYGKITFHDWPGQRDRLLFTIDIGQEATNDTSLVMIVKDEAKGIEKAILSALPFVDNIVVSVDTKTVDDTAIIAALYADTLKYHEWHDDFSEARNYAQKDVTTPWILFLDGHEYIESMGDIKEKMKRNVDGVFVTIRMESGMTFLFPRIYKSHIKFKNKIHNINICKTRCASPDFVIVHDRLNLQDEASTERRNKQREELLPKEMLAQIEKNPKDCRAHFHLANFYMMRQNVDLAMKHYKQAIKYGISVDEKYLSMLHYGALHLAKGHKFRALWTFNGADKLLPGRWESARVIGGFYFSEKYWKKALPYLFDALNQNIRRYTYQPMQQNKSEIWDMIGQCFAQTDQNDKAVTAFERALESNPSPKNIPLLKKKIELVRTLLT